MIITFESNLKNANKWISLESGDCEPLRKASIKSLVESCKQSAELDLSVSACWYFDGSGMKGGYLLTIRLDDGKGDPIEVFPTTKYPFDAQRVFKTFEALEGFCMSIGFSGVQVEFG